MGRDIRESVEIGGIINNCSSVGIYCRRDNMMIQYLGPHAHRRQAINVGATTNSPLSPFSKGDEGGFGEIGRIG